MTVITTAGEALLLAGEIEATSRYWLAFARDACTGAAAQAYEQGRGDGYLQAVADLKAWQQGAVRDLRLERRRWHLCCPRCRREGHRDACTDCRDRARATFPGPMPGDYEGGPVEWRTA